MAWTEKSIDEVTSSGDYEELGETTWLVVGVMRGLARYFGEDEERWGAAGLLHRHPFTKRPNPTLCAHLESGEDRQELGVDDEIVDAVKATTNTTDCQESKMAKALYSADPLPGLIRAVRLSRPKRSYLLSIRTYHPRMERKSSPGARNRDIIRKCDELGLSLGRVRDSA